MISKAILNNVKQYKKRDASMDHHSQIKGLGSNGIKLPNIYNEENKQNSGLHQTKYLRSKAALEGAVSRRVHSRMASMDFKERR